MSEEIEVVELGAVTEMTKGTQSMIQMELGTPPFAWQALPPLP